jgi:hypothetical protein
MMKVVIPGGSGQVGTLLARAFHRDGHQVVVLSRKPGSAPWRVVPSDAKTSGDWIADFEGADAVINLAGRSVNCRYHAENRWAIKQSRVEATRRVAEAISRTTHPPRVWLQMSTATIYAHRYDAANDEATGILGASEPGLPETWRFSVDVAMSWERAVDDAALPHTRKIKLRSAMVMSPDHGGIFDVLLGLVRHDLGGRAGHGRQYVSWIHDRDFVQAVYWLIERDLQGPVNLASPNPVSYADFMRDLREAWGIRFGLPATKWMLEIGALILRSETGDRTGARRPSACSCLVRNVGHLCPTNAPRPRLTDFRARGP